MPAFHIVVLNKLKQEHRDMIEAAAPGSTIVSCDLEEAGVHMDKADILLAWGFNDIRPLFCPLPVCTGFIPSAPAWKN